MSPSVRVGAKANFDRGDYRQNLGSRWSRYDRYPFQSSWFNVHIGNNNSNNWRWQRGWNSYPSYWSWRPAVWTSFNPWFSWNWNSPYRYAYGDNIYYRDNYVYYGEQRYAPATVYYTQASDIARAVPTTVDADAIDWMPLGVFAVVSSDPSKSNTISLQLAISKEGIIAGTYYDETDDISRPLEGMVDQKTQRAAWGFADGKDQDVIFETGIYNLTLEESSLLIHFGPEETQAFTLLRLEQPADAR
ncbi:hypothetical protein Pla8534_23830 [Lignipirellula cremea]|uniref:Uncharacterized protein n=1 Tax=Lignipirellula cremea TaxID=2528010 RepID=A0A518DRW8_9BACT|nr:hypothetical protein Pla8534_23830 [Lignipirellula cremea]